MATATAKTKVFIGGKSLASTVDNGTTFDAVYKGGDITTRTFPNKNDDSQEFVICSVPMEAKIGDKVRQISVTANGRFTENKPKANTAFTVQSEHNEADNGRTYYNFVMCE